jgi:hypothetical protein
MSASEIQDGAPDAPQLGPPCRHLRRNSSFIFTDGLRDDDSDDESSSTFWCLHTMKGFGPDDGFVDRVDCRRTGRSCYEPL